MSLNDTLDRLRADMERRNCEKENLAKMLSGEWQAEVQAAQDKADIAGLAERIFSSACSRILIRACRSRRLMR